MLNYDVSLIRKEDVQIIGIYVLLIKVSDKLFYENVSYLLFSVLKWRRERKSVP